MAVRDNAWYRVQNGMGDFPIREINRLNILVIIENVHNAKRTTSVDTLT